MRQWLESLYPAVEGRDPLIRFHRTLARYVDEDAEVLDLGAGAGINPYDLKGRVKRIVGVDLDPRVLTNPLLDVGHIADVTELPFPDESFDVAFSIYVLEHIAQPDVFLREVARVLRPGGYFVSLTPNRHHYVCLAASITPTRFHRWFNAKRGRAEEDTFPTTYRLNSRRQLEQHARQNGLEVVALDAIEVRPNYLAFSAPTFALGAAYERVVNSTTALSGLRTNLLPVLRKLPHSSRTYR